MKKMALVFSSIEALSSFVGITKAINLSILPRLKIVRGLFTEEEVTTAVNRFGATIMVSPQSVY